MEGPYVIEAELGRGGKGSVYRATDTRNGQTVALRCVDLMGVDVSPAQFRQKLRQEAAKAMELDHPHIIRILDVGEQYTVIYIAMTLTEGVSLGWMFRQGRQFPFDEAQSLARALIGAVAYAHNKGVQHGDLKPGNLLVDNRGSLRIADYGVLSLPVAGMGQPRAASQMPRYASPEQLLNQPTDLSSDVFSLGAILYELFAGRPAFGVNPAISLFDLMQEIIATQPPPPSAINPMLPKALDSLIMSMLERRPENRPRTAAEVLPLLETALAAGSQARDEAEALPKAPSTPAAPEEAFFDLGHEQAPSAPALPTKVAGAGAEASFEAELLEDIARFSHQTDSRLQEALAKETGARPTRAGSPPGLVRPSPALPAQQNPAESIAEKNVSTHTSSLTQSHFLAELAREAERIAPASKENFSAPRLDPEATRAQVDQAMRQVLSYVRELRNQLNIIRPPVPREYNLVGALKLSELRWADSDVNFEYATQLGGKQSLAFVRLRFSLTGPQTLLVKRDGLGVDQMQRHLFDAGMEFDTDEVRNDRGQVERAVFKVNPVVRVRVEILPSYTDGQIIIKGRHVDRFGSTEYRVPAQVMDTKLLDDFSKLLLARPNRMHVWSRPPVRT